MHPLFRSSELSDPTSLPPALERELDAVDLATAEVGLFERAVAPFALVLPTLGAGALRENGPGLVLVVPFDGSASLFDARPITVWQGSEADRDRSPLGRALDGELELPFDLSVQTDANDVRSHFGRELALVGAYLRTHALRVDAWNDALRALARRYLAGRAERAELGRRIVAAYGADHVRNLATVSGFPLAPPR